MGNDQLSWFEKARNLYRAGKGESALEVYRRALVIQPRSIGGWAEYGGLLLILNRVEEAGDACQRALQLDPTHPLALLNSAYVAMRQGQWGAAEKICRRALVLKPGAIDISLALSECLMKSGELDRAQKVVEEVIEREPHSLPARNLLGELFLRQGNWGEIRKEMERRLDTFTGITSALDRACLNLRFGDMPLGWEQYESRWQVPDYSAQQLHFPQPRWDGGSFVGKTLLLYWEQGFGDTLMFVRYAPQVKALGGKVLLVAQARVADLVATCPGIDAVIAHGDPIPPFDVHLPLLSLPWIFHTGLNSIPATIPYLKAPKQIPHQGAITRTLAVSEGKIRVGLVWAGNTTHKNDGKRSIPPRVLSPLAALPEIAWYSFQVDRQDEPPFPGIVSLEPLLSDFSDTAYALSSMDLVITVDTAVAHLAGAMGIPTFLLISSLPDWRWMMGRKDSPWYPTMRIYRQPTPGDWNGVIREVLADLTGDRGVS
jgi:hypothetical protein